MRRSFALGAGLFALSWLVFVANCRVVAGEDTFATALLPFAIWNGDGLALDRFVGTAVAADSYVVWRAGDGHWRSSYPVGTAIVALPFYLPVLAAIGDDARDPALVAAVARPLEKFAAATLAALAVAALFAALRRSTSAGRAALLALAFGLASPLWAVGAQALWQHTAEALLLAVALLVVVRGGRGYGDGLWLGLLATALVWVRPTGAFYAAALAAIGLRRGARPAAGLALVGLAGALAFFTVNLAAGSGWLGAYPWVSGRWFRLSLANAAGPFLSPRGLLFFAPYLPLVVLPPRPHRELGAGDRRSLLLAWGAHAALIATFAPWSGGENYGARYTIDGLPILFVLGARALDAPLARWRAALLAAGALAAAGLQAIGASGFPGGESAFAANRQPIAWSLSRSVVRLAANAGASPPELFPLARLGAQVPLAPENRRASIELLRPLPERVARLGLVEAHLRLRNVGGAKFEPWGGPGGRFAVRLLVVWRAGDRVARWSTFGIGGALAPGEERDRSLALLAPRGPGIFRVEFRWIETTDGDPTLFDEAPSGLATATVAVVRDGPTGEPPRSGR